MFWKKKDKFEQIAESIKNDVCEKAKQSITNYLTDWFGSRKEVPELEKEIKKLKNDIEDLKQKKKREEEDIKHLVKIKQESLEIEHQKKELELKNDFKDKEMKLQKEFHENTLKTIEQAGQKMEGMTKEILNRLPNVNMSIRQRDSNG